LSRWLHRIRVEDLLAGGFAIVLVVYGGTRAVLGGIQLGEEDYWDFSFILAPLSLLVFLAALRYAVSGGQSLLVKTTQRIAELFRDWMPFLLFLLFYEAFRSRIWMVVLSGDKDEELLAIDRAMMGETPSVWLDGWITPWLTDVMVTAYFMHLVLPPVVAFVWYRRDRGRFRIFLLAVLLAGMLGSIGYVIVPAVGPLIAYPEIYRNTLDSFLHAPVTGILDAARAPRDVFPSLHVGLSTIVLWYGARLGRRWTGVLGVFVILNWISTLYLRYHYFIDVIAGWATAALAIWLASRLIALEKKYLR